MLFRSSASSGLLKVTVPAAAPPTVPANGVQNGASFQPGIAANSWVTIQGTDLAPQTDNWNSSIVNGELPTSLDGVKVSMGGKAAYVYYISPTQLNVLAPDLDPGPVPVTVTTPAGTSAPSTVTVSSEDRKSTRLNSSPRTVSRMPSSA